MATIPTRVASRLGPVVPGLANRPGGVWTVTAPPAPYARYRVLPNGQDQAAALSLLAYHASRQGAALHFPAGVYLIPDWRQLGWLSAGQRVMTSQRWIGEAGAVLRTLQALNNEKVYWHGAWFSGLTFQAPNAPGEKLFGGGVQNLFFHQCTIQNCAPDFLDGGEAWVTFYACLFNASADYVRTTAGGYGPCTPQIQQTIGNVKQHFTVDTCSFQFAPHGQSASLISLEGSGLIGDYLINGNHLLDANRPDYLIDAAIDVEPHQAQPISDIAITNNYVWNSRIYIAGVQTATIANNTIHLGKVGQAPAPFVAPYCGNTNTLSGQRWHDRGKRGYGYSLGPAIIGYNSHGNLKNGQPNPSVPNPPAGTITIANNTISYAAVANPQPPIPFWFQQGGTIQALTIQGNRVVQNGQAVTITTKKVVEPPVIAYLSPGAEPGGGWGTVTLADNRIQWGARSKAALVQLNVAAGRSVQQITITGNTITGATGTLSAGLALNATTQAVAQPPAAVARNTPAIANQIVTTGYTFGGPPPASNPLPTPWYRNPRTWLLAGGAGMAGYGIYAYERRRWPFGQ